MHKPSPKKWNFRVLKCSESNCRTVFCVGAGSFVFFLFGGAGFGGLVMLRQIVVLQFGQSEMGFLTGKLVAWNMFFPHSVGNNHPN